jgi:hypothetical protein
MSTVLSAQDHVIAISEDDDTIKLSGESDYNIDLNTFAEKSKGEPEKESTLILGWNKRGCPIIRELDNYVAKGSEIMVVSDNFSMNDDVNSLKNELKNLSIAAKQGHISDREALESLDLNRYNHIIILCYTDNMKAEEADSITLIALLHLRNIAEKSNSRFSIVSEMLDIRNKELAEVTKADDFIISNKLISLMLSQLSENKELKAVFDDLFDAEGSEIYVKPAGEYVLPGREVNFHTVVASAARRNEIAFGYRKNEYAHNSEKAYGVVVNPGKSDMIVLEEKDKVIVIAED